MGRTRSTHGPGRESPRLEKGTRWPKRGLPLPQPTPFGFYFPLAFSPVSGSILSEHIERLAGRVLSSLSGGGLLSLLLQFLSLIHTLSHRLSGRFGFIRNSLI